MRDTASAAPATARFHATGRVDVAVLIVTYGSAAQLEPLIASLRAEAAELSLRVVVGDNSPDGETLRVARRHADVIAVATGGNLGYAGGLNVAAEHAGDAEAHLILNPDARVHRGAVRALLDALRTHPRAGAVVPRLVDADGNTSASLFHEPRLLGALGDAVLGPLWPGRPRVLTGRVTDPRAYDRPGLVDWATGAALLVSAEVAARVGEWDERFFLYSEETDYLRRIRASGYEVRYEPVATVTHTQGGSGWSPMLDALLAVNRVRYARKHAPRVAWAYRAVGLLAAALRAPRDARQRTVLGYLRDERRWGDLPAATWRGDGTPVASIVIPACNEASVIARTLWELATPAALGSLDVIVVCNGCSDDTAARARAFPGVRVVELPEGSKPAALNAGRRLAVADTIVFLDADIALPAAAIPGLVRALRSPGTLAGRPPFEYDTRGAGPLVRSYYRARSRMPATSGALWGAGVYALTREGAERVGPMPRITADDLYVDARLAPQEKARPPVPPVPVRVPRTGRSLLRTLVRVRRGPAQLGLDTGRATLAALVRTVTGPASGWDALVYAAFALAARRRAAAPTTGGWERDDSTRAVVAT
ncbi:glycosyltransferase family 2 protein [Microbacterium album]|uniref:Glycosyltransferase 2-like domain-containing protein n=1 Tax=Microbacterium album TaxID=2053191 RepID=A0A917IFY8_9MICO|nr:glycosyltransferase family 2 protein [Microbacterium album]GGH49085.1 hypothetical protein GCM10010921_27040 [Microbacterium album]